MLTNEPYCEMLPVQFCHVNLAQ